jgi:50S ribosomal protein L16 3-hydroxylase
MIAAMCWDQATIARFVGCYLTEPKPHVVFDRPRHPATLLRFAHTAQRRGLRLDPRTQILYDACCVYVNGASVAWPRGTDTVLKALANQRSIVGEDLNGATVLRVLHEWYRDGFLDFD